MDRRLFRERLPFDEIRASFQWDVPKFLNMAVACCDDWSAKFPNRIAITHVKSDGRASDYSYLDLRRQSNQLANVLTANGTVSGDRVAVLLSQSPQIPISHFAAWKIGAISVPLFTLFGEDGLQYRLADSGASVVITDLANLPKVLAIRGNLPKMKTVLITDGHGPGCLSMAEEMARASDVFQPKRTLAEDDAIIIYTSGTTGPPKGALHAHRFLLGHRPAVELQHEFFPQPGDKGWTPADWAWIGGLMNTAMSCLYYGVPLVSHRMTKFDPEAAYRLIETQGIRNMFLPPTALKMMRQHPPQSRLAVRTIMSGGESLGADMLDWGNATFGCAFNETYGQTECNLCLTSVAGLGVQKPGAIGKAVPGFDVQILDADGRLARIGEIGQIAVRQGVPVMFKRYWQADEKTKEKLVDGWMLTGDLGAVDEEGYITFSSRDDDVITSAGYRIGPTEIENCLTGHPDVAMAAVVGIPDPLRTEVIKAFVVLRDGADLGDLERVLIERVRVRISPHCAPRSIEVVDKMPMTATGKIMRRELRDRG